MREPWCYPRIGEPVETRRQTFDHAACLPSPRTGNGWHDPQSAVGSRLMREPWRLADRLEIHHTPKPGSWLNMAEIELSVLARQCLSRRIAHQDTLTRQIAGWEKRRNAARPQIKWQFTPQDARINLRSLYPSAHA